MRGNTRRDINFRKSREGKAAVKGPKSTPPSSLCPLSIAQLTIAGKRPLCTSFFVGPLSWLCSSHEYKLPTFTNPRIDFYSLLPELRVCDTPFEVS